MQMAARHENLDIKLVLSTDSQQQSEPRHEKTSLRGIQPGPTQTRLYNYRLEISDSGKLRDCTIYLAKTKALISCVVTAQLICSFVFAYAKSRFSHDAAHLKVCMVAQLICTRCFSHVTS